MTTDFDRLLLAETLAYAAKAVPFYQAIKASRGEARELVLADFPIIDKALVNEHFEQFLNLDRFPDFVISSGGTMSNSGALSYRCQDEYEAVHYYLSGKNPRESFDADPASGFALDIFNNTNGYFWRKAPGWPILAVTLEQQTHADLVARLICNGLKVKDHHISVAHVQGQCGPMRALTGYFESIGFEPKSYGAPSLLVYGSHTTRIWKQRFQNVWGHVPFEIYGLSEFSPGSALKCEHCNGFHFWTCWPEFLSLDSEEPVACGDARLILTSLAPFVRLQPRIRYLTGDVVTLTGWCNEMGKMGFRFRGRTLSSLVTRSGFTSSVLFSEQEVLEVLEQLPDVSHQIHISERQIWETARAPKPSYAMGYPRYQFVISKNPCGPTVATITIEVVFDCTSNSARSQRFLERFNELLNNEVPELHLALSEGNFVLNVLLQQDQSLNLRIKSSA